MRCLPGLSEQETTTYWCRYTVVLTVPPRMLCSNQHVAPSMTLFPSRHCCLRQLWARWRTPSALNTYITNDIPFLSPHRKKLHTFDTYCR